MLLPAGRLLQPVLCRDVICRFRWPDAVRSSLLRKRTGCDRTGHQACGERDQGDGSGFHIGENPDGEYLAAFVPVCWLDHPVGDIRSSEREHQVVRWIQSGRSTDREQPGDPHGDRACLDAAGIQMVGSRQVDLSPDRSRTTSAARGVADAVQHRRRSLSRRACVRVQSDPRISKQVPGMERLGAVRLHPVEPVARREVRVRMSCAYLHDGSCSRGLHGGRPSQGVCAVCSEYKGAPRGAGDIVAIAATVTGASLVASAFTKATGRACGCDERRAALNAALPFSDTSGKD